jgi:TonB family protein
LLEVQVPLQLFLRVILLVVLTGVTALGAVAQEHASALEQAVVYPESADGLKRLVQDVFSAMQAKDEAKVSFLCSSMTLPDHAAWFAKTFGPTEGPRVDSAYTNLLPDSQKRIASVFELALKEARTDTQVAVVIKGNHTGEMEQRVVDAMQTPVPLYVAIGSNPKEPHGVTLGHFFYVDGGFRFVTALALQNIGVAPATRIRVSGNMQRNMLVKKVEPVYPATKAKGTVLLHVIVATDGSVSEVSVVNGDPDLGQAAMDAVRQWKYRPTTLNGQPVVVDTVVSVEFRK